MNFLKRTLGKDQPKKYQKLNQPNTTASLRKNKQIWSNIDQLIQNRADKKNRLETYEDFMLKIFRQFDQSRRLLGDVEFNETLQLLLEEYEHSCRQPTTMSLMNKCQPLQDIEQRLETLLKRDKELGNKNLILLFTQKLKKYNQKLRKSGKDKKLQEFDKMVSFMTMKKKPAKILDSSDNKDFILKVTKEQYTLQSKNRLNKKKKSLGTLNSGSMSGSSNQRKSLTKKGSEGDINHVKLQSLLKDVSLKVVKTSIKYDYSAILESSFANIQRRKNTTLNPQLKKEESKPIEKVKKNEGFVFFRPGQKK